MKYIMPIIAPLFTVVVSPPAAAVYAVCIEPVVTLVRNHFDSVKKEQEAFNAALTDDAAEHGIDDVRQRMNAMGREAYVASLLSRSPSRDNTPD